MRSNSAADGYTAKRVLAITGVPYQTLNLWAKTGLIQPKHHESCGQRNERDSFRDLVALKVVVALRGAGVTTKSLVRVVQFLLEHTDYQEPLSALWLSPPAMFFWSSRVTS